MNRYDNQSRSVTPTPQSKYITNGLRNGTSLVSVNSTNPFDEDDDGVSVTGSMSGDSRISKTPRKKRRAPPPPILAEVSVSVNCSQTPYIILMYFNNTLVNYCFVV